MSILFAKIPGFNYSVDEFGNIWNLFDSQPVEKTIIDKITNVNLDFHGSSVVIDLAVLIIFTLILSNRDQNLLNKIVPIYKDGDCTNLSLSNLSYKFKVIDEKNFDLFHPIPLYTNYLVNRKGDVVRACDGLPLNKYLQKGGYLAYSLRRDMGYNNRTKMNTIGRHRVLGLAFIDYATNPDSLDINHIDGIPGSDDLTNLEWVTRSENLLHAYQNGLRTDNDVLLTRNAFTGEVTEHYSISEAARQLGLAHATLVLRLQTPGQKLYRGGYQHKRKSDTTPWRIPNDPEAELRSMGYPMPVVAYNVFTSEYSEYPNANECGRAIGCNGGSIKWKLANPQSKSPLKGYLFKRPWDIVEFPNFTRFQKECFHANNKDLPSPVERLDIETNQVDRFTSVRHAGEVMGISYSTIEACTVKGDTYAKRYTFKYLDLMSLHLETDECLLF